MPCGTTFVDAQGTAPRILSAEMPSHSLSLTQTYGPDTGRVARAVHLSLGGPFAAPLSAGIPASPALCECALRFDLRFVGLCIKHKILFFFCQERNCSSTVFFCQSVFAGASLISSGRGRLCGGPVLPFTALRRRSCRNPGVPSGRSRSALPGGPRFFPGRRPASSSA